MAASGNRCRQLYLGEYMLTKKELNAECMCGDLLGNHGTMAPHECKECSHCKKFRPMKQAHKKKTRSVTFPPESVIREAMRNVESETDKVQTGTSKALSSKLCDFFHDVPPELYRRAAKRYTVGHKKYSPGITQNLNWRIGIDDPLYVMDRLNHLFEHAFNFLEDGNTIDDNLGAIVWCCGFLMEVERLNPAVLDQVIRQSKHHGTFAEGYKAYLEKNQVKSNEDN